MKGSDPNCQSGLEWPSEEDSGRTTDGDTLLVSMKDDLLGGPTSNEQQLCSRDSFILICYRIPSIVVVNSIAQKLHIYPFSSNTRLQSKKHRTRSSCLINVFSGELVPHSATHERVLCFLYCFCMNIIDVAIISGRKNKSKRHCHCLFCSKWSSMVKFMNEPECLKKRSKTIFMNKFKLNNVSHLLISCVSASICDEPYKIWYAH